MTRLVLAAAVVFGTAATSWAAGPGELFAEKANDFGVTPRGTVLVHYFRFTNTSKQTLTVGNPRVSCGCVTASMSKNTIAPGETAAVIAYMDTRRIPQPNVTKTVTVFVPFLAPTQEEVQLKVTTIARDDLLMSPDVLGFGTVKAGEGGKVSTKVTFIGDSNWKITKATSTGGYVKADFKEDSRSAGVVTYEVTATLEKACPAGNWISDINLETSNPAVAKLRVPVTVVVTPAVAVKPEAAAFGELPVGVSTSKKITIEGDKPFKILEVKGVDEQLKVTVDKSAASPVHTIILAANPKSVGGFTRTVEIVTDSKDQPKLVIPVTARVVQK
jgi:hypothetical protein